MTPPYFFTSWKGLNIIREFCVTGRIGLHSKRAGRFLLPRDAPRRWFLRIRIGRVT
ncbi:hypothetical protein NITLEN_40133 [Nitrospira lenta]|uniref:Uncharacterized protein n=1 Tax=Nitrospira lenta TaxID=1436998 RepID=A0A330L6V9_9BACT|nr:hypothetical protein NITLEN_40133 [Nitrospira lenta]